jgi:hypothetical protein
LAIVKQSGHAARTDMAIGSTMPLPQLLVRGANYQNDTSTADGTPLLKLFRAWQKDLYRFPGLTIKK